MAFHNLCKGSKQPPIGIGNLLGLGLNYCIETPFPYQGQPIVDTNRRLHRDIRLGVCFSSFNEDKDDDDLDQYDPKLYVPKTDWIPNCGDQKIKRAFEKFQKTLEELHAMLPMTKHFNLTKQQRFVLSKLKKRDDLVIFPTDKNLGPYIVSRMDYIKQCLNEHLLKQDYYMLLSGTEAETLLKEQSKSLHSLYQDHKKDLSDSHQQYFDHSFELLDKQKNRIPQFYGIWKVHKDKASVRPVISCCGSRPQVFSTYVDYWLKKIVREILPSYLPNIETLIESLNTQFPTGLPTGARLFSIDAVAMYSNIDTEHGLQVCRDFFDKYEDQLPEDAPTEFLLEALEIIMKENIFQFGDTHWLQKIGCAMGTSAAVNYAYLYVGLLEMDS